ncbi:MAG: hypothetical protein M3419_07065 [Actinomycetota bacterium]|nr:hypothetical protein [Actinomycetota bacterium]
MTRGRAEAVIVDWGATLTPWRTVDYQEQWRCVAVLAEVDDIVRAWADG